MRSVAVAPTSAQDHFSVESLLQRLILSAEERGIEIDVELQDDHIWVANIERHDAKAGVGAHILRDLMEIADHHDIPIRGRVVDNPERLLKYYQGLGFAETSRRVCGSKLNIEVEYEP